MSAGMSVCCAIVIARAMWRRRVARSATPFLAREAVRPVLLVLVPAVVMVLLVDFVGWYVAAGLYVAFSIRYIGKHGWGVVLAISVDPAAYLGRELARAEHSLATGGRYVQDAAPERAIEPTAPVPACGAS
jgi:hypothetical protein